ncbi:alpha/beta hydrolase [Rothia kristinae]|uniref:alpha/beta hydrolase n=1 Tax=Rothia kristinae TaxID=37923 RepID=UPI0021A6D301|nr:alpha/beta hydrolase [Rothia kristinae]MCT1357866.1 alpha/beta hydrolase [Rothia kristinae]MCT1393569.1 alpha/beta hydrolase [Rothia kristinae]MCT1505494.1 alpha/beta hydrolase [Rothia kristinae]MCT2038670.1 alpha/beta hydrolase [Rothia kristinae]MCT2242733.1 alpha/beta hydrolase [Rothia kristinae]
MLCALAGIPAALAIVPAAGQVPFALSVLLPTLAPFLAPAALLGAGLVLSGMRARRRVRVASRIRDLSTLALAVLGAVVPGAAYGAVVVTAERAGAPVDLVRTLAPGSMTAPPDRTIPAQDEVHGRLQIWTPPGGAQHAPILFDVHGGGWTTDAQMQATLRDLVQRGWLVVRPEYPLASPGHPTWQEAPRSLARSYAWVARHAGTLGGDPRRISVFGDSAGGGLAVNLADRIAAGTLDGIDDAAALPVPRAVVALYPTVDVAAVQRVRALGAGKAAEEFVGGTPRSIPSATRPWMRAPGRRAVTRRR